MRTVDREMHYLFDYFGFKTLEKSYLLKMHGKVVERPQHLFMRVAVGIHKTDLDEIEQELIEPNEFALFDSSNKAPCGTLLFLL